MLVSNTIIAEFEFDNTWNMSLSRLDLLAYL